MKPTITRPAAWLWRHELLIIMVVAIAVAALMLTLAMQGVITYFGLDTSNYNAAAWTWGGRRIDYMRTPVYPVFLYAISRFVTLEQYSRTVALAQTVIYLASVPYFRRLAHRFTGVRWLALATTLYYAAFPPVVLWNCKVMTESPAMVGVVMFMYCLVLAHDTHRRLPALCAAGWLMFMVFLRPIFVIFLPIVLVAAWLRRSWPAARVLMAGTLLVVAAQLTYMACFYRAHGIFDSSIVPTLNAYHIAGNAGVLDTVHVPPSPIAHVYKQYFHEPKRYYWHEAVHMHSVGGARALRELVDAQVAAHRGELALDAVRRVGLATGDTVPTTMFMPPGRKWKMLDMALPRVNMLYTLIAVYAAVLIVRYRRRAPSQLLPWMWLSMATIATATVVVGAPDDWGRLMLPFMPIFIAMLLDLAPRRRPG